MFYMNLPGDLTVTTKIPAQDFINQSDEIRRELWDIVDRVLLFYTQWEKHVGIIYWDSLWDWETNGWVFSTWEEMFIWDILESPWEFHSKRN